MSPFCPCYLSPCGRGCGKESRHHFAGQPVSGIETRCGAESGKPVWAADALGSREAAAKPVTEDRSHFFLLRGGIAPLLASLPDTAVSDSNRPVIEQIASDRNFVATMMVLPCMMGFKGDGEQI